MRVDVVSSCNIFCQTEIFVRCAVILMGSVSILQDVIEDLIAQMVVMKCIAHVS